jgi:hypothetical protein
VTHTYIPGASHGGHNQHNQHHQKQGHEHHQKQHSDAFAHMTLPPHHGRGGIEGASPGRIAANIRMGGGDNDGPGLDNGRNIHHNKKATIE